jgi:5-methylcytosine-specific restriction endonuclease McrA/DNA-binding CsgD family transcriptional regulator
MQYREEEWLRETYQKHTMDEMAEMEGVSQATIYRWMKRHGIERQSRGCAQAEGKYKDEEWLREQYVKERRSTREIADDFDISAPTIQYWLKKHDIPIRHGGEAIKTQWEGANDRREMQREIARQNLTPWHEMGEEIQQRVRARLSEFWSENNPMEGRTGEQNPAWRGGHEKYYGSNWDEQRQRALNRDGYECQSCGEAPNDPHELPVHHHVPIRWFKNSDAHTREDANQLWNLITLCSGCHGNIESKRLRD